MKRRQVDDAPAVRCCSAGAAGGWGRSAWRRAALHGLVLAVLLLTGCRATPATHVVRGLIVDLQQQDIAHAERITLRTERGETLELQVASTVTFTVAHLREHMLFAEPVTVTYVEDKGENVATVITD